MNLFFIRIVCNLTLRFLLIIFCCAFSSNDEENFFPSIIRIHIDFFILQSFRIVSFLFVALYIRSVRWMGKEITAIQNAWNARYRVDQTDKCTGITHYHTNHSTWNPHIQIIIIIKQQKKCIRLIYFNGIIKAQLNDTAIHDYLYNYCNLGEC